MSADLGFVIKLFRPASRNLGGVLMECGVLRQNVIERLANRACGLPILEHHLFAIRKWSKLTLLHVLSAQLLSLLRPLSSLH